MIGAAMGLLVSFSMIVASALPLKAQGESDLAKTFRYLSGEAERDGAIGNPRINGVDYKGAMTFYYTERELTVYAGVRTVEGEVHRDSRFVTDHDVRFVSARFKSNDSHRILALLSNGTMYVLKADYKNDSWVWAIERTIPKAEFAGAQHILGDAVYVLKFNKPYRSADTAKTWEIDTVGMANESVSFLALDTNHYVWAVTQSRRLFYQHPDSTVWHQDTSFSISGFPSALFIDRKNRMFVAANSTERAKMSLNGGATWTDISAGIGEAIASFGDDALGNVYAVGAVGHCYRLANLTPPWTSVCDSLSALALIPLNNRVVNTLWGDSILYASTKYGKYQSVDAGANWTPSARQSQARNFSTPLVKAGNRVLISTNRGILRATQGDTAWTRTYPENGFVEGINALASDADGKVYGNFPYRINGTTVFQPSISTDQGGTWALDTAGKGALGFNAQFLDHYVDAQGTQYLGGQSILYAKKPGQPWATDTAGLDVLGGGLVRAVSKNNKQGLVYAATAKGGKYRIHRRAADSAQWSQVNSDTLAATDALMWSDHAGNLVVKVFTFPAVIWRYDGSKWSKVPLPNNVNFSPNPEWITVDKSGVLWASFLGSGRPKGVYFTSDNGATWKYAGMDSVGVRFLTAIGDTVHVVTNGEGLASFTTAGSTHLVAGNPAVRPYRLFQNYPNPFKPTARIRFEVPVAGKVKISVHDFRGREVATLVNGRFTAGMHQATWDATGLAGGMYFCRLYHGSADGQGRLTFAAARKMILLK